MLAVSVFLKVLEVLSHVNKRMKGVTTLHLPLAELLALFSEPAQAPLVRNFALVYTETAFERADPSERLTVVSHHTSHKRSRWARPLTFLTLLLLRFHNKSHT